VETLLERSKPGQINVGGAVARGALGQVGAERRQDGRPTGAALTAQPMKFLGALQVIRDVLADNPQVYVVNEGANALDLARNTIPMQVPRHRLDSGTWGVMGIGMGLRHRGRVESGTPSSRSKGTVHSDSAAWSSRRSVVTPADRHRDPQQQRRLPG